MKVVSESEWTEGMRNIVAYAKFLAEELMGVEHCRSVVDTTNNFAACYGDGARTSIFVPFAEIGLTTERPRMSTNSDP